MANDNFPRGLVPIGGPYGGALSVHAYLVTTGADLFLGMPTTLPTSGYVDAIGVTTGNATAALGVIVGFEGGGRGGGALATAAPFLDVSALGSDPTPYVLVADSPDQEYVVQEDTGGTALTQAEAGNVAYLLFRATSGNTDSGWSNLELDASTVAANTNGLVRVLRLHGNVNTDGTDNAVGDYAKWVVTFLNPQKGGAGAVTGVV